MQDERTLPAVSVAVASAVHLKAYSHIINNKNKLHTCRNNNIMQYANEIIICKLSNSSRNVQRYQKNLTEPMLKGQIHIIHGTIYFTEHDKH